MNYSIWNRRVLLLIILFLIVGFLFHIIYPSTVMLIVPSKILAIEGLLTLVITGIIELLFYFRDKSNYIIKWAKMIIFFPLLLVSSGYCLKGYFEILASNMMTYNLVNVQLIIEDKQKKSIHGETYSLICYVPVYSRKIKVPIENKFYRDIEKGDLLELNLRHNDLGLVFSDYFHLITEVTPHKVKSKPSPR